MLIEFWERLRGYDKWVQTEATVESSDVEKVPHYNRGGNVSYTWASGDQLVWTDLQGQRQTAEFKVDEGSPLFQLIGGEKVTIRYNPANPDEFYYRDLLRSRVNSFFRAMLVAGLLALFWVLAMAFGVIFRR
jgi:hypothetical protein